MHGVKWLMLSCCHPVDVYITECFTYVSVCVSESEQWDCVSVKSREQLQRSLSTLQSDSRPDLRDKAQELRRHIQSQPWIQTNTHTTQPHILDGKSNKKLHNLFHSVKFVFCSVFLFDSLDSSNNEFRCDEPVCLTLTMAPNWGFYYCCMFVYSLNINNCFTLADCCQKCWKMKILLLLLTTLWRWKLWSSLVSRMNEVTFSPIRSWN